MSNARMLVLVGSLVASLVALPVGGASAATPAATPASALPSAPASAPSWQPTQAPGPSADTTGVHLEAVDCWAPGNCVAVGFRSGNGTTGSYVDQETNGTWSYVTTYSDAELSAVSCPAAGACVAVGNVGPSSDPEGVLLVQSATGWTEIATTGVTGRYHSYTGSVTGISCPAAGSCAAVGQAQDVNEVSTGYTLTLKPGSDPATPASWIAQQAPEPAGDAAYEDAGLAGVSCVSAGNCRAVGTAHVDANNSHEVPLIDQEHNYVWSYGGGPLPSGAFGGRLKTVACVKGGTACMAGGTYLTNGAPSTRAFDVTIDTTDDSAQAASQALPSPFTGEDIAASSCAPDGQCQVVGLAYANSGSDYGYDGFVISNHYGATAGTSEGSAAATTSPSDANTVEHNEELLSTSCVSGGFCVSVGSYLDNSGPEGQNDVAVIDTRTYSSSGAVTGETDIAAPEPANDDLTDDDQSPLYGVSCNDSSHCTAVGAYFNDNDTKSRGVIDTYGAATTTSALPGSFRPLGPTRILDTRNGTGAPKGAVPTHHALPLQVAGMAGVPATGVSAVVLNVTVTAPSGGGYVTAYADGRTAPTASNLNFVKGQTIANLVVAPVGADGKVALYTSTSTQLIADVAGYFVAGAPTAPGTFGSVGPARVLDTRNGTGAPKAIVPAKHAVTVQVTGANGVPASGVSAVAVNVTVTSPAGGGYVTAYAGGAARPTASNLNFVKGQTVPNLVIVPVSSAGTIALYTSTTTHLVADIAGYYTAGTPAATGAYGAVAPSRLLDTRIKSGPTGGQPVTGSHSITVKVVDRAGVPASGVSAVVVNVTATEPVSGGYVTAYAGGTRPTASNLNYTKGQTVPNLVTVPVNPDGTITLYTSATTHLLADIAGYYRA